MANTPARDLGIPSPFLRHMQHSLNLPILISTEVCFQRSVFLIPEDFIGCLDYIWFSTKDFHCTRVLEVLGEDHLARQKSPLPNPNFPSDHVYMAADLELHAS